MTKAKKILFLLVVSLCFSCVKKENNDNTGNDNYYLSDYLEKTDKLWYDLSKTLDIMADQISTNKNEINELKKRVELLEQRLEDKEP